MSDFASIFNNSFQQAASRKQDRTLGAMFQQGDLQGASDYAFSKGRNDIGMQLRAQVQQQRAQATAEQREAMDRRMKQMGGLAAGLSNVPADQRLRVVQSSPLFQQTFMELGLDPRQINDTHLDDATLQAIIGLQRGAGDTQDHALAVRKQDEVERAALAGEGLDVRKQDEIERAARAGEADALRDDERDALQFDQTLGLKRDTLAETVRSNRAGEGIRRYEGQTGRMNAVTNRQKADAAAEQSAYERANPKQKPFNQAQAGAAGFASRAEAAAADFERIIDSGEHNPLTNLHPRNIPVVGDSFRGGPAREVDAAKREFINAVLRKESGAAISQSEFENAERMFFPSPRDSEASAAQKAQARRRAIEAMKAESQGAYENLFPEDSQPTGDDRFETDLPEGTVIENDAGVRMIVKDGFFVSL